MACREAQLGFRLCLPMLSTTDFSTVLREDEGYFYCVLGPQKSFVI